MASKKKQERLVNLVLFLLQARGPVPIRVIGEKVDGYTDCPSHDALRQKLHRDKEELARMGFHIQYVQDGEGYVLSPESSPLPEIRFTSDERLAFALMLRALEGGRGFPFEEEARAAALKIALGANIELDEARAGGDELFAVFDVASDAERDALAFLSEALTARRRVRFQYQPVSANEGERIVEPFGVGFREGRWYLVGRCPDGEVRIFRTDRMRDLTFAEGSQDDEFDVPTDFEVGRYLEREPWLFEDHEPTTAVVWFSPTVARLAAQRFRGATVQSWGDDGSVTLAIPVTSSRRFLRFVLSFGTDARIVEPDSFIELMREAIDALEGTL